MKKWGIPVGKTVDRAIKKMLSSGYAGQERFFVDKAFARFLIPSLLSNISLALGGVADCLVVGNKIGLNGLSAVSLGIPVYLFYNIISYSFSIGGAVHYEALMAKGKHEEANALFGNILRFLIICYLVTVAAGLLFLPYLLRALGADPAYEAVYVIAKRYIRAQLICVPVLFCQGPLYYFVYGDGAPKRAAAALMISNFVDIVLNYVFVIRLDMGAEGSVWSTAIGAVFCLIICGSYITGKRGTLRFVTGTKLKFDFHTLISCGKTGFSSSVQYLYQFITVLCANMLLINISGPVGVAVFDVVYNLSLFFAAVADSIGMTLQPMVSTYSAARDSEAVRRTMNLSKRYGSMLAILVILGLCFFASPLCTVFGLTGEGSVIGPYAVRVFCIGILPSLWNQIAVYYLQTTKHERSALIVQTLRLLVFYTVLMFVLAAIKAQYFWLALPVSEFMTLIYVLVVEKKQINSERRERSNQRVFSAYIRNGALLSDTVEQIQSTCDEWNCTVQQSYYCSLVTEKICAAILNDAKENNKEDVLIKITLVADEDGITLHLMDNSYEFNPFDVVNDDDPAELGIAIVKKKAKEFFYRRYQGFNTLVVMLG